MRKEDLDENDDLEKQVLDAKLGSRMNRRKALSTAGKAAIGAAVVIVVGGGIAAYYLSQPAAPTTTAPPSTITVTAVPSTVTEVSTITAPSTTETLPDLPPEQDPIIFNSWDYMPDVVQENVKYYMDKYNDVIDYSVVTAADYFAVMETKLIAKTPIDIYYANQPKGFRHYYAGWARDVEDLPHIKEIKADIHPRLLKDVYTDPKTGKLVALPYHLGTILVASNEKVREEAGLKDDYPKTWDELYDQCRTIKGKGVSDNPYLAFWIPAWYSMPYSFSFESGNRGDRLFDPKTFEPTFDTDTPVADVLNSWKEIWDDGLVPSGALAYSYAERLATWAAGGFAFSYQQIYDLRVYNDPKQSTFAGYCSIVPMDKQPWGGLEPTLYMMTERPRSKKKLERVQLFDEFLSWTDFYVGKKWAEVASLVWAYPKIFDDPSYRDIFVKTTTIYRETDYDEFKKQLGYATAPAHWRTLWGAEFDDAVINLVPKAITGDETVNNVINTLRTTAEDLRKRYGE